MPIVRGDRVSLLLEIISSFTGLILFLIYLYRETLGRYGR
jgi:hypothetical protein